MIVVVLGLAIGIAFTDMLSDRLYGNKRMFFILMLVAYAVYRGFRIYQVPQSPRRSEISEDQNKIQNENREG